MSPADGLAEAEFQTPFHRLLNSSDLGVDLWVKREDMIDGIGSGHKARKLRHLIADARSEGSDVLITAASPPSGQAVAVTAAAHRAGMRAHIVYCGDSHHVVPNKLEGNYLLMALLGAEVTWRPGQSFLDWERYLEEAADEAKAAGAKPYVLEPGLSVGPGMLGSVELGREIADQPEFQGTTHLVAVAGSGGTCLGLAYAAAERALDWTIHGVCISTGGSRERSQQQEVELRAKSHKSLVKDTMSQVRVEYWDAAMGAGYDRPTQQEFDALRRGMNRHNLILDTTYMAKAFIGLEQMIERNVIPQDSRVLLVHSGGAMDVFRSNPERDRWASANLGTYLTG